MMVAPACFSIATTDASARGRQPFRSASPFRSENRGIHDVLDADRDAAQRPGACRPRRLVVANEGADGFVLRPIASSEDAIAASAVRSPASMRRWSSASEIMGIFPAVSGQVLRTGSGSGKRPSRHSGRCEHRTRNLEIPGSREDACPGMTAIELITRSGWAKLPRMHDRTPSAKRLTDDERVDRLRLIRTDNVGPRTFRSFSVISAMPAPRWSGCPIWRGAAARRAGAHLQRRERAG